MVELQHEGSAFYSEADSMSEMSFQKIDEQAGTLQSDHPLDITRHKQELNANMDGLTTMLSETRAGNKDVELARCIIELVQANGLLTAQVNRLQESLQLAHKEREELTQSVATAEMEKLALKEQSQQDHVVRQGLAAALLIVKEDHKAVVAELNERKAITTNLPKEHFDAMYMWRTSRAYPGWMDSSYSIDHLKCPPMSSGVHKWSISVVHSTSCGAEMGVASTVVDLNYCPHYRERLGGQAGGWGYSENGEARNPSARGQSKFPGFDKGSKITFLLDLTGTGTLNIIFGKSGFTHRLFSNMLTKDQLIKNAERGVVPGFVPSVCYQKTAGYHKAHTFFRFLGFERVSPKDML